MVSIAFVEYGAKKLVKRAIAVIPNTDPTITLQLVTPTTIKKTAEKKSLEAFKSTFSDTNFKSNKSLIKTLTTKHPFYNGSVYEQFKFSK